MISTRDALDALVDLVSSNLMQLVTLNNDLESYKITSINTIDINKDSSILEKLEITVDLRLKIIEMLSDARKYIIKAVDEGGYDDLIKKLKALAEYYVYAGVRLDRRIANKYRSMFIIDNLDYSIDKLYESFTDILNIMGIKIIK